MFTGIITHMGNITYIQPITENHDAGICLTIEAKGLDISNMAIGDSIAINGACMTIIQKTDTSFCVDVSKESLRLTTGLDKIGPVNLEKAITLSTPIGGHLVTGHVDGLGTVHQIRRMDESTELVIASPRSLAPYLAYKGSIVVNGVSLTVNRVEDLADASLFSVNLIPHTVAVTTLQFLEIGDPVNLEVDLIARYVQRMLSFESDFNKPCT